MRSAKWLLSLALVALVAVCAAAEDADAAAEDADAAADDAAAAAEEPAAAAEEPAAAAADTAATGYEGAVDEEWLNTIWTQVDDMVEQEGYKLQETITVAGVRGAEAEDQILDKLYYKGAKRYPSQEKLKKAIDTLKKAIALAPRGENVAMQKYFVAQCYTKLGETAGAQDYYTQVTRDHADTPWATKARKELAALPALPNE